MCTRLVTRLILAQKDAHGHSKVNPDDAHYLAGLALVLSALCCTAIAGLFMVLIDNVAASCTLAALCILCALVLLLSCCAERFLVVLLCCGKRRTRVTLPVASDDVGVPLTAMSATPPTSLLADDESGSMSAVAAAAAAGAAATTVTQ